MGKPDYRVTKHTADDGRKSTVGRHTTGDAARQARQDRRAGAERGSSDWFTVHEIRHRDDR